jgi:hypothetical protein
MEEEKKKEEDKIIDTTATESSQFVNAGLVTHESIQHAEQTFIPPKRTIVTSNGPRKKTNGEKIFDWVNYAGFGWIANEIVSGKISSNTVEEGSKFYKQYDGILEKIYHLFQKGEFVRTSKLAKNIRTGSDMFIMTLGGHLMVLPIRFFENYKSGIVRGIDGMLGGEAAQKTPERIKAHEDMDNAPQQSWGSLIQGRLVTVVSAIGMHFAIGNKDAWSTKIFKEGSAMDHWSSLHRINTTVSRWLGKTFEPSARDAIEQASQHADYKHTILSEGALKGLEKTGKAPEGLVHEGRIASIGKNYGVIFMVSGILAAGFYLSSKLFANQREKKKEYIQEHGSKSSRRVWLDSEPSYSPQTMELKTASESHEKPKHHVSHVATSQRLEPSHQEAVSVG